MNNEKLEQMKRKLEELKNTNKGRGGDFEKKESKFWKTPKVADGEKTVRILPDLDGVDTFRAVKLIENVMKFPFRSLTELGEQNDPVTEAQQLGWKEWRPLRDAKKACEENGDKEGAEAYQKEMTKILETVIKPLEARDKFFCQIVVRGEEDQGAKVWSMSKAKYEELLTYYLNEDYGDLDSVTEGYDIKITPSLSPKKFKGKDVTDLKLTPRTKPSKLAATKAEQDKILSTRISFDDFLDETYTKTRQEVEQAVQDFLGKVDGQNEVDSLDSSRKDSNEESIEDLLGK